MTIATEQLEALWKPAAVDEVFALMSSGLVLEDLTACELLGMVAMLRTAKARIDAAAAAPAQLTLLRPKSALRSNREMAR
jgi:hypothetical protein